jgi:ribosomal protein S12 methylthiotransferase
MPIQHGSDRILELMRRPERQSTIRERVGWLREAVPNLTLRTTVIVGFPGETDDDFRELLDEIQFERVGAFTYSVEEGTRAAESDGRVPDHVMSDRLEEVMELQRGISFDSNLELVGQTTTVLVDRLLDQDPEYAAVGRTPGQAKDVDGVTHLRADFDVRPGDMVQATIVEAMDYDLVAEVRVP